MKEIIVPVGILIVFFMQIVIIAGFHATQDRLKSMEKLYSKMMESFLEGHSYLIKAMEFNGQQLKTMGNQCDRLGEIIKLSTDIHADMTKQYKILSEQLDKTEEKYSNLYEQYLEIDKHIGDIYGENYYLETHMSEIHEGMNQIHDLMVKLIPAEKEKEAVKTPVEAFSKLANEITSTINEAPIVEETPAKNTRASRAKKNKSNSLDPEPRKEN